MPAAKEWLRQYTRFNCGYTFRLDTPYLVEDPDFPPLVRYLGHFNADEEAQADPTLAIARFLQYRTPGLKGFLQHNCPRLLQEVGRLNRELRQEHRDRPFGSNPIDYYEAPEERRVGRVRRPNVDGAGVQYQRDLAARQEQLPVDQVEEEEEEAPPEEGLPWRPTLTAPRRPEGEQQQPSRPPQGPQQPPYPPPSHSPAAEERRQKAAKLPSPPDYPPPGHPAQGPQDPPPPLPPPAEPPPRSDAPVDPPPLVPPRQREQQPQHPPGPPRSARLEQAARSRAPASTPRGRAETRGAAPGAPVSETRPKVVLKEREETDPRDNRPKPALSHRPSSRSAPRRVQLAGRPSVREPSPVRTVVVNEPREVQDGAASGAPSSSEEELIPDRPTEHRQAPTGSEQEDDQHHRSRSEPPKRRTRPSRISPSDRPLVLRPAVQPYPVTRIDQSGTWALIAPAPTGSVGTAPLQGAATGAPIGGHIPPVAIAQGGAQVTHLVGPKAALISSSEPGVPQYTAEKWEAGPSTQLFSYAQEGDDEQAESEHRSTSSGSAAGRPIAREQPKRSFSEVYSLSPPPPASPSPSVVPQSRFQQQASSVAVGSVGLTERDRELPLSGTLEAPVETAPARSRGNPPPPPPAKKSRVTVTYRPAPVRQTPPSSSQVPISPPTVRLSAKGAASSEAHREPSFGPTTPSGTVAPALVSAPKAAKYKAFPDPPPQVPKPATPRPEASRERVKSPPPCAGVDKEEYKEAKGREQRERSTRSRSKSKNKITGRRPSPPELPAQEVWFNPDPTPSHPSRPEREAPRPLVPPLHESIAEKPKTKKAPPGKAPPARVVQERAQAKGAASSAPSSGLAPHPEGDQDREPYLSEHQRRRKFEPRYTRLNWAPHRAFRIGLDWHGLLDRNLNYTGVFPNHTAQLIASLNSRALPIEFAVVSFAGHDRATNLDPELATFCESARAQGIPFAGYIITKERVGPGGKSDTVAAHHINCLIDDTDYICNEVKQTGALTFFQTSRDHHNYEHWIYFLQDLLANWKGTIEELCDRYRPVKLLPKQYLQDPKSGRQSGY